jgi:hypothetical protein
MKLLVVTPDPAERLEDDGLADAERRFGVPVTHALIGR